MENNCLSKSKMDRRSFGKTMMTAAAAVAAPQVIASSVLGKDGATKPSERITLATIGAGGRGCWVTRNAQSLSNTQMLAVSDCRAERRTRLKNAINGDYAKRFGKGTYQAVDEYLDYREILDRDDVDAIINMTNDHWHGIVVHDAITAGKDIYTEKPLSRWIDEGVRLKKAVRQYGTILQVGTQQRSDVNFWRAAFLARNGYLGDVRKAYVAVPSGEIYPAVPTCAVPEGFDYDRWSGPAPYIPYDAQRTVGHGYYMISHYCAGFITNWGVHHLDIACWGMPEFAEKPFTVEGTGMMPTEGITDTWLSWQCKLRWDSGREIVFSDIGKTMRGRKAGGVDRDPRLAKWGEPGVQGCRFEGTEGWVHVNRQHRITASNPALLKIQPKPGDELMSQPSGGWSGVCARHVGNFIESVQTRQDPVAPVEAGHVASTLGNVSDIALRLNRKLRWAPAQDKFIDDDVANSMCFRAHRAPWTV
jgi:myo-inositol 2-dehydrogenase / D-chiro-inositol 1-dehydrogenase